MFERRAYLLDMTRRVPTMRTAQDLVDILASMRRAGERGELLSIVSHGIAPDAKRINMKTEWLERMLAAANDFGVIVRGLR